MATASQEQKQVWGPAHGCRKREKTEAELSDGGYRGSRQGKQEAVFGRSRGVIVQKGHFKPEGSEGGTGRSEPPNQDTHRREARVGRRGPKWAERL